MIIHLRYAVTDGPDGTDVCVRPTNAGLARELRARHDNVFWCTTQAGGCGGRLELAAGDVRATYFRHKVSDRRCAILDGTRTEEDGYFHLGYQHALGNWLRAQGYSPTIEHTFPEDGGRADLHVVVEDVSHSIEVQLSRITSAAWRERDTRYSGHADRVTWLHGPDCEPALTADRLEHEIALQIRTHDNDVVQLGVHWDHEQTDWVDLTDCTMTPDGIHVPPAEDARVKAREAKQARVQRAEADRAAVERRRVDEAERTARFNRAWVARRAQEEARRQEQTTVYIAAGGVDPRPAYRTFEQWERLHPEMAGWALTEDWSWLSGFDDTERRAGQWMAYLVTRLYAKATIDDLRHPELTDESFDALVGALFTAGLARMEDGNPYRRWERAAAG